MIGQKLSGRYALFEKIGGGGTAVVYRAKDMLLNRTVAVKILRSQYTTDDHFVKRFRREAQSAASLSHPQIVNIYDVGVDGEYHYIVMEYVDGPTLKEHITKHAPLPVEEAVHITMQIAEALQHAHQNNIIHRDIKPHNILMSKDGKAKVTDFGIARAVSSATMTHTGSVMGSVHYFSPEQARGGLTGEKSDIYSLGVVLYEMVTGELPFSGESPISVALKHLQDSFEEPRQLNAAIPQSVENIIIRSLVKEQNQRYHSAHELLEDLSTCLHPDRLWEDKITTDTADLEATKIMPALVDYDTQQASARPTQNAYDSTDEYVNNVGSTDGGNGHEENGAHRPLGNQGEDKSRRGLFIRLGIVFVILLLLTIGVYQYVTGLFHVDDVEVLHVVGQPLNIAVEMLEESGLTVNPVHIETYHDEIEEGYVVSQSRQSGAFVREGASITLTVSLGKQKIEMRNVEGLHENNALRILERQLQIPEDNIEIETQYHSDVRAGYVISQYPEAGEMLIPDEAHVFLVISVGVETSEMPDLIGKTLAEAQSLLDRSGLELESVEYEYNEQYAEGQVYRQTPFEPGEEVAIGSPIYIWISEGPEFKTIVHEVYVEMTAPPEQTFIPPGLRPDNDDNDEPEQEEHTTLVSIVVSDAISSNRTEVDQTTITENTTFPIEVTVSRDEHAVIQVFRDGNLYKTEEVKFE